MKKFLFIFGFFLLAPAGAAHADAISLLDASVVYDNGWAGGTSFTHSLTVSSGSNTMLLIRPFLTQCNSGAPSRTVTSVTFNGTALTKADSAGISNGCWMEQGVWYLLNPPATTANVVITASAGTEMQGFEASTYTGVKQTAQPDAHASESDSSCENPETLSVTTTADNAWIFDAISGGVITGPSSGQTLSVSGNNTWSYKAATTAGSYSMGWVGSPYYATPHVVAAFTPAAGVGYNIVEGRFTGGSGDASSTNYQAVETSFDQFSGGSVTSTNYALENKAGILGSVDVASVNSVSPSDFARLYTDQNASYTITAVSPDGDTLQYSAKQDSTTKVSPQSSSTVSWTLSSSDIGRHTMSLEVTDPQGMTLKKQEAYVVRRPTK